MKCALVAGGLNSSWLAQAVEIRTQAESVGVVRAQCDSPVGLCDGYVAYPFFWEGSGAC